MARFVKLSDWRQALMWVNADQVEFFTQTHAGGAEIVFASGSTLAAHSFVEVERALTKEDNT
jgi:hypothetical protein